MKLLNKFFILSATVLAGVMAPSCTLDSPITNPPVVIDPVEPERGTFAKGADVSWVTQFENEGYTFQNANGEQKELMTLLRQDCGVNSIRLRVWVNPEVDPVVKGWCDIHDMVVKARRAHALGMRIMVDFHFSDTWADPGTQNIPSAWKDMTIDQVLVAMTNHVNEALTALKNYGIEPEWVQIGNETRTGMMWPLGQIDNGDNFTRMVNAGYDAVKAVFPESLVIVHLDSGDQLGLYTRVFNKLKNEGGKYDMIGMSLYPSINDWETMVANCLSNVSTLQKTYGKPVMMCEIGFDYKEADIANRMMRKLNDEGRSAGLQGIFWWEPETPTNNAYKKGCFDENGCPTSALDVFKTAQ